MKKTFVTNLVLLVGLNLLIKPFYVLGIEAEIQNRVGASEFGLYAALISLSFMFNIVLDMGITNWNNREVALSHQLSPLFNSILRLRIALAGIYILICLIVGLSVGYSAPHVELLLLLGLNQILATLVLFFRSNLSGMHFFKKDSLISILDRALLIFGMGYLLWAPHQLGPFKIEWLIIGQTFAYLFTALLAGFWVLKLRKKTNSNFNRKEVNHILSSSLPFALFSLLGMLLYRIDSVLLERLASPQKAGIYAQGFRVFEAYNMLSFLFAGLLLPIFSRLIATKAPVQEILSISHRQLFAATFMLTTFCVFNPEFILNIFYDQVTSESVQSFQWLMIGCFGFSMQYIYGTLLTAAGKLRLLTKIMLLGLAISLTFNFALIPSEGAVASAKANAFAQITILLIETFYCIKLFKINPLDQFKETLLFSLLISVIGFGLFIFKDHYAINQLGITLVAVIFMAIGLMIALTTKMLSVKSFIALMKMKD